jgi:hypothetical protein
MTSIWASLVHVLVTDGPFFISPAGSDQLHQDLDGHRPNLWQEVGVQQCKWNKFNRRNDESFILIWLGFQIFTNSLKSFISAPVRLIGKRG